MCAYITPCLDLDNSADELLLWKQIVFVDDYDLAHFDVSGRIALFPSRLSTRRRHTSHKSVSSKDSLRKRF